MANQSFPYVIVGGGLTGTAAAEGIREIDNSKPILLIGAEKFLPYHRPPLTKKLWFGKMTFADIFIHDQEYYEKQQILLQLGTTVTTINSAAKELIDNQGNSYHYDKLLLATGAHPRRLNLPGGEFAGLCYYRYADDYLAIRESAGQGRSALVIGGGFIGSEIAAALNMNHVEVTLLFPGDYLCDKVFPQSLGQALTAYYRKRDIKVLTNDRAVAFGKNDGQFITRTLNGKTILSDLVIIGIGVVPELLLAGQAGLNTGNGIIVNNYLETSQPDIYAAGDNACFPLANLDILMRVEHWDNALSQGKVAGRNMAGAYDEYTHLPYFFSDLFDFGYEAVGLVSPQLATYADWQKENEQGVIYYLDKNRLRGALMCNLWDKVGLARELIKKNTAVGQPEELKGLIR